MPNSGGLTSLASVMPQPQQNQQQPLMGLQPNQPQQPQVTQITIRPPGAGGPNPIQQTGGPPPQGPTRLNLPTVPVPEASLAQQRPTLVSQPSMSMPNAGSQQTRPMNAIAQQGQMVMTRPRGMPPQFQQQTSASGPQTMMRPMMITGKIFNSNSITNFFRKLMEILKFY